MPGYEGPEDNGASAGADGEAQEKQSAFQIAVSVAHAADSKVSEGVSE